MTTGDSNHDIDKGFFIYRLLASCPIKQVWHTFAPMELSFSALKESISFLKKKADFPLLWHTAFPYILHDKSKTPILSLPVEIWLQIAKLLEASPASLLAWRYTCKRAQSILPWPQLDEEASKQFCDKFRHDRLRRYRTLHDSPLLKLCYGCLSGHSEIYFIPAQLKLPARKRYCREWTSKAAEISLCKHNSLSYEQLRQIRPYLNLIGATPSHGTVYLRLLGKDYWKAHQSKEVDHLGYVTMSGYIPSLMEQLAEEHNFPDVFWHDWKCVMQWAVLQNSDLSIWSVFAIRWDPTQKKAARKAEVSKRLRDHTSLLCPHLRGREFSKLALWMEHEPRAYFEDRPVTTMVCSEAGCDTTIALRVSHDSQQDGPYRVHIHRTLGDMENSCDPRWLAQIGQELPKIEWDNRVHEGEIEQPLAAAREGRFELEYLVDLACSKPMAMEAITGGKR